MSKEKAWIPSQRIRNKLEKAWSWGQGGSFGLGESYIIIAHFFQGYVI